jgi:hypothetical protein
MSGAAHPGNGWLVVRKHRAEEVDFLGESGILAASGSIKRRAAVQIYNEYPGRPAREFPGRVPMAHKDLCRRCS